MGGCLSSSSDGDFPGDSTKQAEYIRKAMREGAGLSTTARLPSRNGLSGAGSFYLKERVPSKSAMKSPGSMRTAKITNLASECSDTNNLNCSSILLVRPRTDSFANMVPTYGSPEDSPGVMCLEPNGRTSPELLPTYGSPQASPRVICFEPNGRTSPELLQNAGYAGLSSESLAPINPDSPRPIHQANDDNDDVHIIRGGSDPTNDSFVINNAPHSPTSFNRASDYQDITGRMNSGSMSCGHWQRTSDRVQSGWSSSQGSHSGQFKRISSVRLAVMGKVQGPGEWDSEGPSAVDMESKSSSSSRFKKISRLGGPASVGVKRISITSKTQSDLADLADI